MSYITCYGCQGRKQVSPLGGILKNCAICDGVGFKMIETSVQPDVIQPTSTLVDPAPHPFANVHLCVVDEIKERVKYGRKKKVLIK